MTKENKRLTAFLLAASLLLLIPFVAMQFTDEVKWSLFDFMAAGVLLFGTGLMCEFVMRKVSKISYRIVICAVLLAVLFLVWLELAVGIFGSRFSGQ